MALTANEQTLLDVLTSMETEGTLDEVTTLQLAELRKLASEPDTDSYKTDDTKDNNCECPACIYNKLVYPDSLDEEERFKFAINSLVQNFIKNNKDSMFKTLDSILSTSPEAEELVKAQKAFYENIIAGNALHDNLMISYNDLVKQFELDNIKNYFEILSSELESREMLKHVLNLDIQNMESFLEHYSRCQHEIFIATILTLKFIQRGVTAADMCIKLNQPYDKIHFISNVYSLEIQWERISKIALMLPTKSVEHKMKMTANNSL